MKVQTRFLYMQNVHVYINKNVLRSFFHARFVKFEMSWSRVGGIAIHINDEFVKREVNFVKRASIIANQLISVAHLGRPTVLRDDVRYSKMQIETVKTYAVTREALVKSGLVANGKHYSRLVFNVWIQMEKNCTTTSCKYRIILVDGLLSVRLNIATWYIVCTYITHAGITVCAPMF